MKQGAPLNITAAAGIRIEGYGPAPLKDWKCNHSVVKPPLKDFQSLRIQCSLANAVGAVVRGAAGCGAASV